MVERRHIQRISFSPPITAKLGDTAVRLCDLSTTGARVEHSSGFAPGGTFAFHVSWRGEEFVIRALVTRCRLAPTTGAKTLGYQCGLHFVDVEGQSRDMLHRFLAVHVEASMETKRKHDERGEKKVASLSRSA